MTDRPTLTDRAAAAYEPVRAAELAERDRQAVEDARSRVEQAGAARAQLVTQLRDVLDVVEPDEVWTTPHGNATVADIAEDLSIPEALAEIIKATPAPRGIPWLRVAAVADDRVFSCQWEAETSQPGAAPPLVVMVRNGTNRAPGGWRPAVVTSLASLGRELADEADRYPR